MKVKTLLLGSAAAFAVVGSAQAADLTIAEPVDYVRVCDAFGTGYWYLPGTDTCIKVGGEVTFDINFHSLSTVLYNTSEPSQNFESWGDLFEYLNGDPADFVGQATNHSANWDFVTGAKIKLTGKSQTELGELTAYVAITAKSENAQLKTLDAYNTPGGIDVTNIAHYQDNDRIFKIDEAYLELGWLSAGYRGSTYDPSGGHVGTSYRSDTKTDQIRATWAMGGFSLMLAAEDPLDRWGSSLGEIANMPDLIAAMSWSQPTWSGMLSFGFAGPLYDVGNVWGVNLGLAFKLDSIAPGDELRLNVAAGTGSAFVSQSDATDGATNVSAFASFEHNWTPTWSTALTGTALWTSGDFIKWAASGGLVWAPVDNFSVAARAVYEDKNPSDGNPGSWAGRVELKRVIQ